MIGGFRQVIAKEGAGALLTGAGPTFAGYFLQGAFKFGGYEFFKQQSIKLLGYETAKENRTAVYLASAACAEFFADVADHRAVLDVEQHGVGIQPLRGEPRDPPSPAST